MPFSSVQCYTDPEQFEAAYAATKVDLTQSGRSPFTAHVVRVELGNLWVHQVKESVPRIKHKEHAGGRAFFKFLPLPGQKFMIQGDALPDEGIIGHSRGQSYYERTNGTVCWASISLPIPDMIAASTAMRGFNLLDAYDARVVVPSADAMSRLRQLHKTAVDLAGTAPHLLATPMVAHGLQQLLVEALVGAFDNPNVHATKWRQQAHATIMRRLRDLLKDNPSRPIYIPEICAAIRVPERTLRQCCHEQLGMSPKQFLLLCRIHQARRVLRTTSPAETTVTEIAMRFGFWHLSRFAETYRSTFGELPSVTLRAPCTPNGSSAARPTLQ